MSEYKPPRDQEVRREERGVEGRVLTDLSSLSFFSHQEYIINFIYT